MVPYNIYILAQQTGNSNGCFCTICKYCQFLHTCRPIFFQIQQENREVYHYVINGVSQNEVSIVLQHDIHDYSIAAVEDIITWGLDNGYQFLPLKENSPGFHHDVNN